MFGVSFSELAVIALVALIVVGPHKLPGMLRTLGEWIGKMRRLSSEVRAQTGIDEILRQEGIEGGLGELRSMLRGDFAVAQHSHRTHPAADPYPDAVEVDRYREYPPEGPDAYGTLPDDLVDDAVDEQYPAASEGGAQPTRTDQSPR